MLGDSSNRHKQKLVRPKPLASKMAAVKKVGQKYGGLLVDWLSIYSVAWMKRLCFQAKLDLKSN